MKITKYPQSCLLVETNNKKILVDAGGLKYKEEYFDIWKQANIILLTHKHGDHVNYDVLKNIDVPIYSTLEVQNTYPELKINIIK
jgi:L-ascorbate metabolism protein UlaG (beta-lactamase superfamily)